MKLLLKHKLLAPLALSLLIATIALGLEAYVSIVMMEVIDTSMSNGLTWPSYGIIALLVLAFLQFPINLAMTFAQQFYRERAMVRLKHDYLVQVFKKDAAAFDREHSTDYISAMTQDMQVIETGYVLGLFDLIYQIIGFVISLCLIVYVSYWLPIMGLVLALLVAVISSVMGKPLKSLQKKRSDLFQSYSAYIQGSLSAFHLIRVNHLTEKAKADFNQKSKAIQHQGFLIDRLNSYIFASQNLIMSMMMVGMMGAATYLTVVGAMTFGGVVLVINSIDRIAGPIQMLGELLPKLSGSKVLFDKHREQLEKDQVVVASENLKTATFNEGLTLQNLSFNYPNTHYDVLSDTSMTIEPGKKYLVLGPSGGGKSTLLKLLRRYYPPTRGSIKLDGESVEHLHPDQYYQLIGNVEQQVFLFEDTLRANLSLYKEIPESRLTQVLQWAGLQGFVNNLPDGLDTMIYDNGKNLSGGERSRIAIARALLLDAKILLLDEPFSSLDDLVARQIESTLLALEHVTLVHVTHVYFEDHRHLYDQVLDVSHQKIVVR